MKHTLMWLAIAGVAFVGGRLSVRQHNYQLQTEAGVILRLDAQTGEVCMISAGDWTASDQSARIARSIPIYKK